MTAGQDPVGFIGTGVMGAPMAEHLMDAGWTLHVHSRTRDKATALIDRGAVWHDTPATLARACRAIVTLVGFPDDVERLYLGPEGLVAQAASATLLIDMTTSRPDLARRIHAAASARDLPAVDAPVSGGEKGAREATLSIMVGGDDEAVARAMPLLRVMGRTIVHQGPAGSGQATKLVNQIAIAGGMVAICEAMAFAQRSGLDPEKVLASIARGAAGSWSLTNLAPKMVAGDFRAGFYVKHFIKDMAMAAEAADAAGLDTPGLDLALSLYRRLAEAGGADHGTQGLYRLYAAAVADSQRP